jgi:hypothetical protein
MGLKDRRDEGDPYAGGPDSGQKRPPPSPQPPWLFYHPPPYNQTLPKTPLPHPLKLPHLHPYLTILTRLVGIRRNP